MLDKSLNRENVISMRHNIHPTAFVSPGANIHPSVEIAPFAFIGDNVSIDEGTTIGPHAVIEGRTTIGKRNQIFAGAVVGSVPQDLKYKGEESYLVIGNDNLIREYMTINLGTKGGGGQTIIGNNNLMMSYVHIAHDVCIGNNNVIANATGIGGHVIIGDWVTIGASTGVHQFNQLGNFSMIGAHSKITKDVPPYALVDGNPAKLRGVNFVRLRRNSFTPEERRVIQLAFKILYDAGLSLSEAIETMERELPASIHVENIQDFLRRSDRGIYR